MGGMVTRPVCPISLCISRHIPAPIVSFSFLVFFGFQSYFGALFVPLRHLCWPTPFLYVVFLLLAVTIKPSREKSAKKRKKKEVAMRHCNLMRSDSQKKRLKNVEKRRFFLPPAN